MKKVAIIGSGFGGLSLAIRLQSKGYKVTIFEKQEKVGGHAYQLKKNGYTFDLGPSLITAPSIIRSIFDAAGEKMEDHLDLMRLDPFYRIYFADGTYFDYSGDPEKMKSEIAKFSEEDAANYDKFMELTSLLYKYVITDGLGSKPFLTMKDFITAAPKLLSTGSILPTYTQTSRYFKHPNIRFVFSFHPLFIGGNPFNAPALYLMIPYLEREEGVWFSKGGMYSLVEAFKNLFEAKGGVIKTSTEVKRIETEDRKVTGVITDKSEEGFDLVVSNAHIYHTYKDLLNGTKRKRWNDKKLKKSKYSMSSFLLYLGVKKQYPELKHHTLILSERYKDLVNEIFANKELPDDFSMYLHAPTKSDPTMAPDGCESMYVLIPTPNLSANIDWKKMKFPYADKIIDFLEKDFGLTDLRKNIEVMEIFTPEDFKDKRNSYLGSAWGLQPVLTQSANFRAHNRSEDVENLYIVGASTHPGAGVPGVMLTAETTAKLIYKDHPIE